MGKTEVTAKIRRKKRNLREALLFTVKVAGIISIGAIAPKLLRLFPRADLSPRFRAEAKRGLVRLKQKGEVEFIVEDGQTFIQLTARGERTLALSGEKMRLTKENPKKWDGSYRLVIFDIAEKRKQVRDFLRREMQEVGFLRIQDSVWIFPYGCEEFIALLKADLAIGKDVLYAVVDSIDNDAWVRKHFGLPAN